MNWFGGAMRMKALETRRVVGVALMAKRSSLSRR